VNAHAAPAVVLVADDEPTMLELVARHLRSIEQPKLDVIEASDGDEAWRLARERLPDLVVLDVMMPGMSGWEVCRKIRQDAGLAHTGVLMLTGIGENLNEATSPLFGADDYIDKPFDFEKLDQKVRAVLERRATQRDAVPRPRGARSRSSSPATNGLGANHAEAKGRAPAEKTSRASKTTRPKRKANRSAITEKGKRRNRAAKKGAKKGAKKAAKKSAKKAKKGAKKGRK
jgi:DNA-binding response OmpR family regulator